MLSISKTLRYSFYACVRNMHKMWRLSLVDETGVFQFVLSASLPLDPRCPLDNEVSPYTMYIYNICKGRLGSRFFFWGGGVYRVRLHFNERFREIFPEVADLAPVQCVCVRARACVCVCVCLCVCVCVCVPSTAYATCNQCHGLKSHLTNRRSRITIVKRKAKIQLL